VPGTSGALITDAVGPLVIAPGTVDSTGILIRQSVFRAIPDFSSATIDQLAPLQIRVDAASEAVPFALGPIADFVQVRGNLGHLLATVTSALTVTRGTVLAVSLLLLVLAVTALSQIAQLLTEAREGERHLMRARGASSGQLVALATIEAGVVMALTIAVSPPLAVALSGAVTALSPWASSSRTGSIEVPATLWLTAALVAVIFAVVLILPALRRDGTFHDGEQSKARGGRTSALQRYGIDLVLLVLAAIAFWQLRSYQGTAGVVTALSVDPILVVGPALVLVAGALLCARLVPVAARIAERLAAGSLGVTLPLAAWEISRRAQRVTAAVVLVTLAVATGVFSQAFLATWRQSQVDQAAFALGAPARAVGDVDPESTIPWTPVLRTPASLAGVDAYYLGAESATGVDVTALGLDVDARALLTTVGEGQPGRAIANGLSDSVPASTGIPLPEGTRAIDLQVSVTPTVPLRDIIADLRAVIESPDGSLRSVDIAAVSVNGEEHSTTAVLPEPTGDGESLVAIQATLAGDLAARGNPEGTALLSIRGLAARPEADSAANAVPLVIEDLGAWSAASDSRGASASVTEPDDAQIGVEFAIPVSLNLEPSAIVLMAWPMVDELPIVVSRDLLGTMDAREKDGLTLILGDALMRARVVDSVSGVPGGGDATELDVLTIGTSVRGAVEQTLVVDRTLLGRALAQLGAIEPASTERWSGSGAVSGAADGAATVETLGSLTSSLQDHPVRASIQAALWLVIVGAALLAAIGFATYTTGSLRSRTVEFAQLRAIGLSRGALIRVVTIESLLLSLFGGLAGVGLGVLLGSMVVPLVGSSVDGTPPVPPVAMVIPWSGIALLAVVLIVVLAGVVVVVARMQKTIDPARILREGGDR
jgi:hypothetical protein